MTSNAILRSSLGALAACTTAGCLQPRERAPSNRAAPVFCEPTRSSSSRTLMGCDRLNSNVTSLPRAARKMRISRDDLIFRNSSALHAEYVIEGNIGTGRYGEVFVARHRRLGVKRAIKKISMADIIVHDLGEEVRALIGLDHPHIVKAIEYFEDDTYFYLVQEFCTGPDLFDYTAEQAAAGGPVSEKAASIILRQCLKAMICCHANGYIHRDIKPENFMVTGSDNTVKLIDFGLATRFLSTEQLTRVTGTLDYMAPEMLQNVTYNNAADLWGLGVLAFVLLSTELLLPEEASEKRSMLKDPGYVQRRMKKCTVLSERNLTPAARDFLLRLLEYDPAKRITAHEALAHPFIQEPWGQSLDHTALPWRGEFDKDVMSKLRKFAEAPRLKKAALLAMAHLATAQPHSQELLEVQHTFRFVDQDGDGHISCKELECKLKECGVEPPADFEMVFNICDGSSSGSLTYVEFVACCFPDSCFDDKLCSEAFHLLNRSGNGRISTADLQAFCQSYRYLTMEFKEMIREVDSSGKGHLTAKDFHKMMSSEVTVTPQAGIEQQQGILSGGWSLVKRFGL